MSEIPPDDLTEIADAALSRQPDFGKVTKILADLHQSDARSLEERRAILRVARIAAGNDECLNLLVSQHEKRFGR